MKPIDCYEILKSCIDKQINFKFLIKKLSEKLEDVKSSENKNLLHLICEKNSTELVDFTIKTLEREKFIELREKTDNETKKPFDLLNDENKFLFKKVFLEN